MPCLGGPFCCPPNNVVNSHRSTLRGCTIPVPLHIVNMTTASGRPLPPGNTCAGYSSVRSLNRLPVRHGRMTHWGFDLAHSQAAQGALRQPCSGCATSQEPRITQAPTWPSPLLHLGPPPFTTPFSSHQPANQAVCHSTRSRPRRSTVFHHVSCSSATH